MRLVWCALFALSVDAAPPELKSMLPFAAAPGTTNRVQFEEKSDPWPPKVWTNPPGLTFTPETNKSWFSLTIATNAIPGPRLVRLYNTDGVSEPRFFMIDDSRQMEEKEPNSRLAEAQDPGPLPIIVNGRLNKMEDVDCFRIALRKGDGLEASVEAYTLMSKLDALLRVVTTNGVTLAWNHDFATFDPHLWWHAPQDQTVILQVFGFAYPANSDIKLFGGDEANYRLHLGTNALPAWKDSITNSPALPLAVTGTISAPGEEDRFVFTAKKDQFIEARAAAAKFGSRLDPWLKILDADGKQLAFEDDAEASRDSRLEWKAPADTNYFLAVGSTINRGGNDYHYRLTARTVLPEFRTIWATNSLVLTNDTTNTVKFNIKRLRGHTNALLAELRGLPGGVTCPSTNIADKSGEVALTLSATNASPFQGPIQLLVTDTIAKTTKPALIELTIRGENNGVPNGYTTLAIESYDQFWLTVKTQAMKEVATNTAPK